MDAFSKNETLMNYMSGNHSEEHFVYDVVGEPIADWKGNWDIGEYDDGGEEFEDLSWELWKNIKPLIQRWTPTGTSTQHRDFSDAKLIVTKHRGLRDIIMALESGSDDEDRLLQQAIQMTTSLLSKLKSLQ